MSKNRGVKKPKLRDLSRDLPSREEIMAVFNAAYEAEPIACAILGAVQVEQELEALLRYRLVRQNDEEWAKLVDFDGPLGTFYQKILLARALRLFDQDVADNLHVIRNIRNAFAHSKRLIDFEHELIVKELRATKVPKTRKRDHREIKELKYHPQTCYLSLCHCVSMMILRRHTAALRSVNRRYNKKGHPSYYQQLISSLGANALKAIPGSNPQLLPDDQTFDPKDSTPAQSHRETLATPPKSGGKKDK